MSHRGRHVRLLGWLGQRRIPRRALGAALMLILLMPVASRSLAAQDSGIPGPSFLAFSNFFEEPGLIRYNRVEAISIGTRVAYGFEGWIGDLTLRLGSADRKPNTSVTFRKRSRIGEVFLEAGVGLRGTQPFDEPLGFENSVGAVLTGRDLGEYLREKTGRIGLRAFDGSWSVAVRATSESPVTVEPERVWSLLRHGGHTQPLGTGIERPLAGVDRTRRVLLEASVHQVWGQDPHRPSLEFRAVGFANGSHQGGAARQTLTLPLGRGARRQARPIFSLQLRNEVGGVSTGSPAQDWRTVGGPWTLRGWEPGALRGSRWVVARAQANIHLVLGTAGLFFDAAAVGQAAPSFPSQRTRASSIGVDLAFLDGAIRLEVATRLGQSDGIYVDGGLARPW